MRDGSDLDTWPAAVSHVGDGLLARLSAWHVDVLFLVLALILASIMLPRLRRLAGLSLRAAVRRPPSTRPRLRS